MKRNRLKITMESRIHGDVYVRFGGERLETYRPKGRQGALRLACVEYVPWVRVYKCLDMDARKMRYERRLRKILEGKKK